jgi:non-heme chloroperoxidase
LQARKFARLYRENDAVMKDNNLVETEILGQRLRYRPLEVRTPDGLRISVQDWRAQGSATHPGRDVLLIHGISQAHQCWFKQISSPLQQRHRLVTYDLRGHGGSDKPVSGQYYKEGARWADEVQAVMEAVGLVRPVIVAWSYGGRVALDYLRTAGGQSISGLVMVAGTSCANASVFGSGTSVLQRMGTVANPADNLEVTREFLHRCVSRPLPCAEHELMLSYNLLVPPAIRSAMGGRAAAYESVLRSLKTPVLAIHGSEDCFNLPAMAEYTARTCPNARALVYDGIGHAPFWETAPRFNADLADYLDSLPSPDDAG